MRVPKWLKIGKIIGLMCSTVTQLSPRNRILVLAPGSLGDMVLFYGVLTSILVHSPQREFVVVVSDTALAVLSPLVHNHKRFPNIRIVVLPYHLRASSSLYVRLIRVISAVRIFRWRYQMVFNPVFACGFFSHMLCAMADAEEKIWFENGITLDTSDKPDGIYTRLVRTEPDMHEIDRMAYIASEAGLMPVSSRGDYLPDLALTEDERKKAREIVKQCREQMGKNVLLIALCSGARFKLKDWGTTNFARLIKQLESRITEWKISILMVGGAEDRKRFDEIVRDVNGVGGRVLCLNLAGDLTPRESSALIEQCDICIGNDTFGLHAAVAVDMPSVVVMWGGDFPHWVPWKDTELHRMVYHKMDCFGCHGECRYAEPKCVMGISVDSVLDEVLKLLEIRGKR